MEQKPETVGDILRRLRQGLTPFPQPSENNTERLKRLKEYSDKEQARLVNEAVCKQCLDTKLMHPRDEQGKLDYSRVVPCRFCITPSELCKSLGISSIDSTFDNLNQVKGIADALKASRAIAGLKTDWKLLLIFGKWGSGKTHLLEAIALELFRQGKWARVETFPDFIGRLKNTFDRVRGKEDQTFEEMIASICKTPYLLLDDVGAAGSFTDFALQQFERIMLARYRDNLFTVATTNLDLKELPHFVTSRFSDGEKGRVVLNSAEDYRPKKGKK